MKRLAAAASVGTLAYLPVVALAQDANFGGIGTFFQSITTFINNTLIPLLFAAALLVFLYGMFKFFILGGGDEGSRSEGRQLMLWAIIAFVVMVSIFGIVNLISSGLGFDANNDRIDIPSVPTR